jgi:Transposase zinc-ribbon domain
MTRRPKPVPQMTVAQFEAMFPDETACRAYLQARRWPNGVRCPRCGNNEVFPVRTMPFKWQCYDCTPIGGYRFSVIAGTIFENTNKSLREWFRVVHFMLAGRKDISVLQIKSLMGCKSETARSICNKIRAALIEPEAKFGGIVEIAEAYVGGKNRTFHRDKGEGVPGRGARRKTTIVGAIKPKAFKKRDRSQNSK